MSGTLLGTAALIGSGLTAFYMSRMLLVTFTGARRWDEGRHPHEAPPVMTWPAILLAIGSLGGGAFLILGSRLTGFLAPVTGTPPASPGLFTPVSLGALTLVVAAASLGWAMYGRRAVPATAPAAGFAVTAARRDLYGDAFNESVLMRPGQWLTRLPVFFDNRGVDGLVNAAAAVGGSSGRLRRVQNGMVRTYFLTMLAGSVAVALIPGPSARGAPAGVHGQNLTVKWVALGFTVATLAVTLAMAASFRPGGPDFQFTQVYRWIPQFGAYYAVGVDGIALVLILMAEKKA